MAAEQSQKKLGKLQDQKLMRERSIRTNRRNKFFDCLTSQDVNICASALPTLACIPLTYTNP